MRGSRRGPRAGSSAWSTTGIGGAGRATDAPRTRRAPSAGIGSRSSRRRSYRRGRSGRARDDPA